MRASLRLLPRILTVLVLAVAVVSCGDDDGEDAADLPTTTEPTTTTDGEDDGTTTTSDTDGTTTTAPADEGTELLGDPSTETVTSEGYPGAGTTTYLTDVRLGSHDGFERIVFEFTDGVPGHEVGYVDPPVTEAGSGREVDVDGSAYLSVSMSPASGVDLSGEEPREVYDGPDRVAIPDPDVIVEAVETGDFEAVLTWVLGTVEETPFAVTTLEDPARLVVDVTTP